MACWKMPLGIVMALSASACVATHQERVALRMGRPAAPPAALIAYAPPSAEYPSVGGDILRAALPPTR